MEFARRIQTEIESIAGLISRFWSASRMTLGLIAVHALGLVASGLWFARVASVGVESLIAASRIGVFTSDLRQFLVGFIASSFLAVFIFHWGKIWEGAANKLWVFATWVFAIIGIVIMEFSLLPAIVLMLPFWIAYREGSVKPHFALGVLLALTVFWGYDAVLSFLNSNESLTKLAIIAGVYGIVLVHIIRGTNLDR